MIKYLLLILVPSLMVSFYDFDQPKQGMQLMSEIDTLPERKDYFTKQVDEILWGCAMTEAQMDKDVAAYRARRAKLKKAGKLAGKGGKRNFNYCLSLHLETDSITYADFANEAACIAWLEDLAEVAADIFELHDIELRLVSTKVNTTHCWADDLTLNQDVSQQWGYNGGFELPGQVRGWVSKKVGFTLANGLFRLCYGGEETTQGITGPFFQVFRASTDSVRPFPLEQRETRLVAHEIGHLIGLQHTFLCKWGTNSDEKIDSCETFPHVHPCDLVNDPIPDAELGTIMSYCQTQGDSIYLTKGFGVEPTDSMLKYIFEAPCLAGPGVLNLSGNVQGDYTGHLINGTSLVAIDDINFYCDSLKVNPTFSMNDSVIVQTRVLGCK